MGKAKRKKQKETYPANAAKSKLCVGQENCQTGCTVIIKRIPEDIKKAKKKGFEIDSIHTIKEPKKNHTNGLAAVHLLGTDGVLYQVGFPYYRLTGRLQNGKKVPGTYIEQKKKKKK